MPKGILYLVGLHIGNVDDVSKRTLDYIKNAKNLVIEREEAFERIWPSLGIEKPNANLISIEYTSNGGEPGFSNEEKYTNEVINLLNNGEDVYVLADEGMPGVADPGTLLVQQAIQNGIVVKSTPGPSIAMAATAVTGTMHNFIFESFLPFEKEHRIQFLKVRKDALYPMVIVLRNEIRDPLARGPMYGDEIPNFLDECIDVLGEKRGAALCYNLTMPNERVIRGSLQRLKEYFNGREREPSLITMVIDSKHGHMAV